MILLNELGGPGLANVEVTATVGANPTTSDSFGNFTLEFPHKIAGDTVRIIVNKEGYVVVNDVQLEVVLPANADAMRLTIILCKEVDREEMARRFYRLKSFEAIEETYKMRLKDLEDTHQASAVALEKLQQERNQAKAAAEKASEELAKTQAGQSSELYRNSQRLFLDGKTEEAINLLDDEALRRSLAQAKKAVENAMQAWLLKARLFTVQFRFDEADKAFLLAIEAVPDNFEAHFVYASFNQELNRYKKAEVAYDWCLEWARKSGKSAQLADTLNNLGILASSHERIAEARKEYEEALRSYRELAQESPEIYLPDVARTLNNLGVLNQHDKRLGDARTAYEEALRSYRELAQKNPEIYLPDVATTLNNLGNLDLVQNRIEQAANEYGEALNIRRELAQKDPESNLPKVADTLNNLGILYRVQNRLEEARVEYEEALKTYRELAQKNPESNLPYVALTLNNLGNLNRDQKRLEEARKEYEEALKIYKDFEKRDPEQFSPNVERIERLLEDVSG